MVLKGSKTRGGKSACDRGTALSSAEAPRIMLIIFGFGLLRTWSVIGGSPTLFIPAESMLLESERSAALGEDILYAVTLIVLSIVALRTDCINRKALMLVSTAVLCFGGVLFLFAPLLGAQALSASMVGRVMLASAACIAVLWGERLCIAGPRASLVIIASSYALSYAGTLVFVVSSATM